MQYINNIRPRNHLQITLRFRIGSRKNWCKNATQAYAGYPNRAKTKTPIEIINNGTIITRSSLDNTRAFAREGSHIIFGENLVLRKFFYIKYLDTGTKADYAKSRIS